MWDALHECVAHVTTSAVDVLAMINKTIEDVFAIHFHGRDQSPWRFSNSQHTGANIFHRDELTRIDKAAASVEKQLKCFWMVPKCRSMTSSLEFWPVGTLVLIETLCLLLGEFYAATKRAEIIGLGSYNNFLHGFYQACLRRVFGNLRKSKAKGSWKSKVDDTDCTSSG